MKLLSSLLLGSAFSLSIGGMLLYAYHQVPLYLIEITIGAVIVLFILAYFVYNLKEVAIDIATALGVFAPILSLSMPAHLAILASFGNGGWLISADGLLQALGFYVFPVAYVILRVTLHSRISSEKAARKKERKMEINERDTSIGSREEKVH